MLKIDKSAKLKFLIKNDAHFSADRSDLKTEAYALRTKFDRKRDLKNDLKIRCRIRKTLRLKPVALKEGQITEKIMRGHNPERATKTMPAKKAVGDNYDPLAE